MATETKNDPNLPGGAALRARTSHEKTEMLAGRLYRASDPLLVEERKRARTLLHAYNRSLPEEEALRRSILEELLGAVGDNCTIEPPFHCDYGAHLRVGRSFYANVGFVALDVVPIEIGDEVLFGPHVQLLAATHPLDPELRASGAELGKPISIGSRAWLGGSVVVCPGVRIGEGSVIGAGSVVTKDIPDRVLAVGNPCRVVRPL